MGQLENEGLKAQYRIDEVEQALQLSQDEIDQFEKEGVFEYLDDLRQGLDRKNFERLKSAVSLYRELGVNLAGIDIILAMKEKMSKMQVDFNDLLTNVQKKLGSKIDKDLQEIKKNLE